MQRRTLFNSLAILAICLVGIFAPDLATTSSRSLAAVDEGSRRLQPEPLPVGIGFMCPEEGQEAFTVDWSAVDLVDDQAVQTVTFPNGYSLTMSITSTEPGKAVTWGLDDDKNLKFTAGKDLTKADVVNPDGTSDPEYPTGYGTMTLEFDRELEGLYISISDVDSNAATTDAVRIRMYNADSGVVPATIASTGTIKVKDNFAFASKAGQKAVNPGKEASLYAQASGPVQTIALDQTVFTFQESKIGQFKQRTIYPALDFSYCAPTVPPTEAPVAPAVAPVDETKPPVTETKPPVATETKPPVRAPVAPSPAPFDGGVNGDPLIMGLSGQLFKFDGRNGAWYSAVSTPSFQWNLKIQEYEKCPADSNSFVSGAGFSFLKDGEVTKKIEVNVVNPYNVDVGCGSANMDRCLGAGSLELVIDGVKHSVGGDYLTEDGTARIVAYNTFFQCSRKWYDFDVRPSFSTESVSLRSSRSLSGSEPTIFDVISGLKGTMIDEDECEKWIQDRKTYGDLFSQPGHYTTIIIKTPEVTLHLEYKQENERCEAHSIDVWISSVSSALLDEKWEGLIGETKDPKYAPTGKQFPVQRSTFLKYASDDDYEVISPFSRRCKGCYHR